MTYTVRKTIKGQVYLYEYESVRIGKKTKHVYKGYLGPEKDIIARGTSEEPREIEVEKALEYGSMAALHSIAESIGLSSAIDSNTTKGGGAPLGKVIEAMVINRCVDPVSRHAFRNWYDLTALSSILGLPSKAVEDQNLYNAMNYLTEDHVVAIQKELFESVKKAYSPDLSVLMYDITSSYFEGVNCVIAKYGYSRDHRPDKLQINLGLIVNRDGIPIVHEVLNGNLNDKSTVKESISRLTDEFNLPKPIIITDRGMVSGPNLEHISKDYDYIVALMNGKDEKRIISSLSDAQYASVNIMSSDEIIGKEWLLNENEFEGKRWVIAWNKEKSDEDRAFRELQITKTEQELKKIQRRCGKTLKTKDDVLIAIGYLWAKRKVRKYLKVKINSRGPPRIDFERRGEIIAADQVLDGKFIIETTILPLQAKEILRLYIEKDTVEKAFQMIKSIIALRPIYVHDEVHVRAHVFICVLALLLMSLLKIRLDRAGKKMTSVAALNALESIHQVELTVGASKNPITQLTRIDGIQQHIFNQAGVSPNSLK